MGYYKQKLIESGLFPRPIEQDEVIITKSKKEKIMYDEIMYLLENDEMPEVSCTNKECDEVRVVEQDADYECPVCHRGRLTSPIRIAGMI